MSGAKLKLGDTEVYRARVPVLSKFIGERFSIYLGGLFQRHEFLNIPCELASGGYALWWTDPKMASMTSASWWGTFM